MPPTTIHCELKPDFLERIATAKKPVAAVAELIWNALDADAKRVAVDVVRNGAGGVDLLRVTDDGHGITPQLARQGFGSLGGSWKKTKRKTDGGRILHGKNGEGRFKAFSLGNQIKWRTSVLVDGQLKEFTITGTFMTLADMEMSEPVISTQNSPGTTVEVRQITDGLRSLDNAEAVAKDLAMQFALYLRGCPGVEITFDGVRVDMRDAEENWAEQDLPPVTLENGVPYSAKLAVIEWKVRTERALFLCDPAGLVLERIPPGIQEPDANFTAYLKSQAVVDLESKGALFNELNADVRRLQAAAKVGMKNYFRSRRARAATGLIEQWKAERVYPFAGEPKTLIERTEREVFDVVAKNVNDYLPQFEESDFHSKRFALRLLKEVMESSPSAAKDIIREVLDLPKDRAAELADLLQRTSLTGMINAAKMVTDRLDFLAGLQLLLFNAKSKQQLRERKQLQKILEPHAWLWGEQFALSAADRDLNAVLAKHLEALGREPGADPEDEDVLVPEKGRGIVDLMLSRSFLTQTEPSVQHHLVVELKRPSQKITRKVLDQIDGYALAVAGDERFRDTNTHWEFVAVSNEIESGARQRVTQKDRPFGFLVEYAQPAPIKVFAMPWAKVLEMATARLRFFKDALEYSATDESGLAYLRKVHQKHLPPAFDEAAAPPLDVNP